MHAYDARRRRHTTSGSLLTDAIPIRTWAQCDDAVPAYVEIDLVGQEGGNALGEHADIRTRDRCRHLDSAPLGANQGPQRGCSPRGTPSSREPWR